MVATNHDGHPDICATGRYYIPRCKKKKKKKKKKKNVKSDEVSMHFRQTSHLGTRQNESLLFNIFGKNARSCICFCQTDLL